MADGDGGVTVVAVWTDDQCQSIWCVSDTRVSSKQHTGAIRLTDNGTKLIAIPYTCREVSTEPTIERTPFFWGALGFAFAGNTSAALFTATTATTLFKELNVLSNQKYPLKMVELAALIGKIAKHYYLASMAAHNGSQSGAFEFIIFGVCAWSKRAEAYHIQFETVNSVVSYSVKNIDFENTRYFAIGSGKSRLDEEISKISEECEQRRPQKAIQNIIREDALDVGGYMSLGIASSFDIKIHWVPEEYQAGDPRAWRSFNGIDIDELGQAGNCFIGGPGMTKAA